DGLTGGTAGGAVLGADPPGVQSHGGVRLPPVDGIERGEIHGALGGVPGETRDAPPRKRGITEGRGRKLDVFDTDRAISEAEGLIREGRRGEFHCRPVGRSRGEVGLEDAFGYARLQLTDDLTPLGEGPDLVSAALGDGLPGVVGIEEIEPAV